MTSYFPLHPVPQSVKDDDARRAAADLERARAGNIVEEYQESLQQAIAEVLGPDWALVSVVEIEEIAYEMENEPAKLARRIAALRRQSKRHADLAQLVPLLNARVEELAPRLEKAEESLSWLRATA